MKYLFIDGNLPSINQLPSSSATLDFPSDLVLVRNGQGNVPLKFGDELLYPDTKGKIVRKVICPVDHGTMGDSIARVMKLRDLRITTRTLNALEAAGFFTAGQVHDTADEDLIAKPNFARRDLTDIRRALREVGLERHK